MKKLFLALVLFPVLALPAQAKDWKIDYAHSTLGFTGDQSGQKFQGSFKKFDAQVSFDPDHLDTSKVTVNVDIGSIGTGDDERDSYLPQSEWFKVAAFPTAQFNATSFHKTGENAYEAVGTLKIKGITKPITLPFTLTQEGDHWHMKGHTTLMRKDFSIGEGSFGNESYVKNAVDVTVDLSAKPAS